MENKLDSRLVEEAYERLKDVVKETPLELNKALSEKYNAQVYLKREDLQLVRSYKLRGAYNKIVSLAAREREKGVVCASAGNHAQGLAFSCEKLKIKGVIYMPKNTPKQKVERVKVLGGAWTELKLIGDTFDDAYKQAKEFASKCEMVFVHPFDDDLVIAGQGTVSVEVFKSLGDSVDYIIAPVGGGGLLSGLVSYASNKFPKTKLIGVEPEGAPSMSRALEAGKVVTLQSIDTFVDGAAVKTVGARTFEIIKSTVDQLLLVPEGRVCQEMISLYQNDGIVAEPAGALSVAALDELKDEIKGKIVVCIVSGGNNDISRYSEVVERSLVYQGLKHYFIIEFSQRPGSLRTYLDQALGKDDDITLFEYIKKNSRETGPALVGVELTRKQDLQPLLKRMEGIGLTYELLKSNSVMFRFLI
jgi:threonine dehydratase